MYFYTVSIGTLLCGDIHWILHVITEYIFLYLYPQAKNKNAHGRVRMRKPITIISSSITCVHHCLHSSLSYNIYLSPPPAIHAILYLHVSHVHLPLPNLANNICIYINHLLILKVKML